MDTWELDRPSQLAAKNNKYTTSKPLLSKLVTNIWESAAFNHSGARY